MATHTQDVKKVENKKNEGWLTSWPSLILFCIVLPIAFRSVFYTPFHIPSGSMKPTLLIGDYLFASKFTYGYSKYSFPFAIKFFDNREESTGPERGDIVIFRPPPAPSVDFIKRVIGLPGDTVQVKEGVLYINDKMVERERIEDFEEVQEDGSVFKAEQYIETLPNGVSYHVLDADKHGRLDNTMIYHVPEGNYFVMGDNRDHSADSRTNTVGFLPKENLVGRAEVIAISTKEPIWHLWKWFGNFRGERNLTDLHP